MPEQNLAAGELEHILLDSLERSIDEIKWNMNRIYNDLFFDTLMYFVTDNIDSRKATERIFSLWKLYDAFDYRIKHVTNDFESNESNVIAALENIKQKAEDIIKNNPGIYISYQENVCFLFNFYNGKEENEFASHNSDFPETFISYNVLKKLAMQMSEVSIEKKEHHGVKIIAMEKPTPGEDFYVFDEMWEGAQEYLKSHISNLQNSLKYLRIRRILYSISCPAAVGLVAGADGTINQILNNSILFSLLTSLYKDLPSFRGSSAKSKQKKDMGYLLKNNQKIIDFHKHHSEYVDIIYSRIQVVSDHILKYLSNN